jgi:plasmid stability protein
MYRVSQNLRIPNSEHGREGPSEARKILRKKNFALPEEDINTLILFNTFQPSYPQ